jgi:hypothetical protein
MPTTTKMGIVYPSSTDLVKDGATAMGTISTTVDAKTGLVLLNTSTFSAVSSYSLPADTFTANYDHYRLVFNITSLTGTVIIRLRASGSDNSSSSYKYSTGFAGTYASGTFNAASSTGDTSFNYIVESAEATGAIDFFNPKRSVKTQMAGLLGQSDRGRVTTGIFDATTSFDSLSLLATSITGKASVYGYNI